MARTVGRPNAEVSRDELVAERLHHVGAVAAGAVNQQHVAAGRADGIAAKHVDAAALDRRERAPRRVVGLDPPDGGARPKNVGHCKKYQNKEGEEQTGVSGSGHEPSCSYGRARDRAIYAR